MPVESGHLEHESPLSECRVSHDHRQAGAAEFAFSQILVTVAARAEG
jgi:hypothetical protein